MHTQDAVVPHAGTWIEILDTEQIDVSALVVPHAGTWIEMTAIMGLMNQTWVVPHAGTWIEIIDVIQKYDVVESFPTRERGLK